MDKISYTPIPHFVYPIPQSQLIWVKHRVSSYFLTCVYGHSANDRAGSTVKLWSAYKLMVVLLSLLANHFSHFGTYSDITDEELFVIVVASSKVDMLDPISALVDVKLMQTIRMSRIRINVIVEYAVGMKILLWSHSSKTMSCRDASFALTSASPVTTKLASWHFSASIQWNIRDNRFGRQMHPMNSASPRTLVCSVCVIKSNYTCAFTITVVETIELYVSQYPIVSINVETMTEHSTDGTNTLQCSFAFWCVSVVSTDFINIWISHCFHSTCILGLRPANERRRFFVTTSLIGWAQT